MRAPAALAALPFLVGTGTALLLWPRLGSDSIVCGVGASTLALLAAAADDETLSLCMSLATGFLFAGLTLGIIAAERAYRAPLLAWFETQQGSEPVMLEGVLREDAALTPFGASVALDVERVGWQAITGGVRLSVVGGLAPAAAGEWRRGRRIRVTATLRRPSEYYDPGVPEQTRALARRGVCLVGSVKSASLVETLARASFILEATGTVRSWIRRRLTTAISPSSERSAAVTTAILIGDRSRLSREDEQRLQDAGTYHVIAISGGNIALVTLLLMMVGRALFLPVAWAAASTIVALLFYALITGPTPSVERAVTAAVIFLTARLIDHRGPPMNALAVAALFGVARTPVAILDPGFILSFGATVGILVGAPLVQLRRPRAQLTFVKRTLHAIGRTGGTILMATVCAELVLLPVSASLFGRVTFAGLILNFVAIPLMTVVQIAGALVTIVPALWWTLRSATVWAVHGAASGLIESARLVEVAPWLVKIVSPPSWPLVALYYVALIATLSPRLRHRAMPCAAATMALMLAGPHALTRDAVAPSRFPVRVVVLDVGQGDATFVSFPDRHTLLVDAGGVGQVSIPEAESEIAFDIGARVVGPALRALGTSRLEALVLTHGDPDHILGVPAVFHEFTVGSIWEGIAVPPHAGLQTIRQIAFHAGATWRTVQAGDRETFGGVEVRALHPPLPEWERQRIRNEDSVVLELRIGKVSIVLAGDIGKEGEGAILPYLEPGRLTVLKAGHHGSATSSTPELLAKIRPAVVIFSAGRDNRFGHPHRTVVERFEALGTAIFRTDQDGAVVIETDGQVVEVRGWTGRAVALRSESADVRYEQRATSTSNELRATSNEQRATSTSHEQ